MVRVWKYAVAATIIAAFPPLAFAQSTGQFSKVENRDCKVWNPNPAPNELVYWTGKCENGFGAGHGILAYGILENGRAEVSLTDVTLKNGRQTGVGAYYSRKGSAMLQTYENGATIKRETIDPNRYGAPAKEDIYAANYKQGLVEGVREAELKSLIDYAGYDYLLSRNVEGQPLIGFTDDLGQTIYAAGTACLPNEGLCRGLQLLVILEGESPVSWDDINSFNTRYSMAKVTRADDNSRKVTLSFYAILDAGQKPENIRLTFTNFSDLVKKAKSELKVK